MIGPVQNILLGSVQNILIICAKKILDQCETHQVFSSKRDIQEYFYINTNNVWIYVNYLKIETCGIIFRSYDTIYHWQFWTKALKLPKMSEICCVWNLRSFCVSSSNNPTDIALKILNIFKIQDMFSDFFNFWRHPSNGSVSQRP